MGGPCAASRNVLFWRILMVLQRAKIGHKKKLKSTDFVKDPLLPCSWVWGLGRIAAMAAIPAPCACVECMRPAAQAGGPRTAERRAVLPARPSGPAPVLGDAGRGLRDAKSLETHSASDQGRPNRKAKSISGARKSLTSASPTWNCLWHLARHCPLRMQAAGRQDGSPGPPAHAVRAYRGAFRATLHPARS